MAKRPLAFGDLLRRGFPSVCDPTSADSQRAVAEMVSTPQSSEMAGGSLKEFGDLTGIYRRKNAKTAGPAEALSA